MQRVLLVGLCLIATACSSRWDVPLPEPPQVSPSSPDREIVRTIYERSFVDMYRRDLSDPLRLEALRTEATLIYARFCRDPVSIHQEKEQLQITGLNEIQNYRLYRLIECDFDWNAAQRAKSDAGLPGRGNFYDFLSNDGTLTDIQLAKSDDPFSFFPRPDLSAVRTEVATDLPSDWLLTEESSGSYIDATLLDGASGS